jgi:plasmid replication initiation protein
MNKNKNANSITKYDNYVNEIRLNKLTPTELNLMFKFFTDLRGEDSERIYSYHELRQILGDDTMHRTNEDFTRMIMGISTKFASIPFYYEDEHKVGIFMPFHYFEADKDEFCLTVSINDRFKPYLNGLLNNYTSFIIEDFMRIKGKYAKHLFRLLKQYRTTGYMEIDLGMLRYSLDIPDSIPNFKISEKVIDIAIKELNHYFKNLKYEPMKAHKRGAPLVGYRFKFEKEDLYVTSTYDGQMTIDDFE